MKKRSFIFSLALTAALAACASSALAQQTAYERFRAHNDAMTALQPSWVAPLVQSDSRLGQFVRLSFSSSYMPGTHSLSYGNGKGFGVIAFNRFQFDFMPPSYFQNYSSTMKDGAGDTGTQVKFRIASGNAQHGNYALSAIVSKSFATGSYANGMATGIFGPRLAAGWARKRFDVQTTLGGALPTGKIAAQGRAIEWNVTAQAHASAHLWLGVEDNAAFNLGGPFDGTVQNFATPAAFYVVRPRSWKPTHAFVIFDGGMQIATTRFHFYNHNLISEMRVLF